MSVSNIDNVLNPNFPISSSIIIFLFEDFDRFLSDQDGEQIIDQLLNGIGNKGNIVRFFTGNNCEVILKNKALINRMNHTFVFDMPTRDMYEMKMKQLFSYHQSYNEESAKIFLDRICKQTPRMSMRPFINYILIYLFQDDFLQQLINNLE